jgi:mycothiol synthase
MCRAAEVGAKVAQVNISQNNVAARVLLSGLGFRLVRRFLELELGLSGIRSLSPDSVTLPCRSLRSGEESILTEIQNRAFGGTWGYSPNTLEEVIYRLNLSDCSPEDVILACEGGNPVGYCWTTMESGKRSEVRTRSGRIYMLGVEPGCRGRGVGKQVLLAGLAHLRRKGSEVVRLTVDDENKEACALYRALGFKASSTSLWYEKVLG